ncbi:hypothetical protein IVB34_01610 [Bradyrhizobium sp. 2]|uniref:hypothetical protein n=1 Tax=Bradyrhizobium sp. 2 TaxID=190045 RepID=UPI001FF80C24|nr:hypothetical protein [Bradyrhizobium sp. 2]MCK1457090.1 hypothetical protein [Bradyrhizobium sp. 2]
MMRIGLIVVGLCTLTIMELGTPARTKTSASDGFEQLMVDVIVSRDTLETADRLEIHHLQHEAPVQPISPAEPTPPPNVTAIIPEEESGTVGRGTNDRKEVVRKLYPKPKYTTPDKPRPKLTNSNKAPKTERSKAMVEVKLCRPNAFDSLLRALNLSSRCQT